VAAGLAHAHRHGVVHGNLRPSNILFDSSNNVKVGDFALPEHYARKRNNWYTAPEREKSELADIYSLGVILYRLLMMRLPFRGAEGDLKWIAKSNDPRFTILNVLCQMLEREPYRRPHSFDQILQIIALFERPKPQASFTAKSTEKGSQSSGNVHHATVAISHSE
jgi:serine/threonine protein kinase